MSVFLKFLFNEENLRDWLRPEWLKHYEPSFVDDQLVGKVHYCLGPCGGGFMVLIYIASRPTLSPIRPGC